ncbi:DegT/DnrJ/EryC1/StrS aminotransferase family protein [Agrococcus sp. HG114]|uniref:DegT/DnrJ/EryC1/StrS family aminotransferase n=1 Tax=Agrococcus sp. HG114 TaxID=2969757 RepID=UPI00215A106F|nr:aminotransferase class I/II-fold pyridoxal phosphate-dependent enzyme [Agrococcus sp. HG114]MCR8669854.1 aminotransferase class I/II-fold pyridoxal phosphate-dependent enzyme [Agrococcus sp. HG114]
MNDRIYMSSPDIGEAEKAAVRAAMDSGWIAPLGPDVEGFEQDLAARVGAAHGVALSSGTAALHLGLLGLGVGPGDVVVTSSMTFAATANAIVYTGATPVFIDSDLATGNMDVALLNEALNTLAAEGTPAKAIVPVDLLGKAVDYTVIEALAHQHGIPVLADAAESLGATHGGRAAGSFGAASIVSFNGNKIMTTSGGGMLLTDDEALAQRTRYLATQARQPVAHYEHVDIGYNYRLSNLLAALGRAQLVRLDEMIARRRARRAEYAALFADVGGVEIFGGDGAEDNCWLTSIVVDERAHFAPAELQAYLAERSIESRALWKPMHLQPVFADRRAFVNGNAQRLFETGLTLPSGSALTDKQFARVTGAVREFLAAR